MKKDKEIEDKAKEAIFNLVMTRIAEVHNDTDPIGLPIFLKGKEERRYTSRDLLVSYYDGLVQGLRVGIARKSSVGAEEFGKLSVKWREELFPVSGDQ